MSFNIGLSVCKQRELVKEIRGYFTNRIYPGVSEFNRSFGSTERSVKPGLKEDEKKNGRRDSQCIKTNEERVIRMEILRCCLLGCCRRNQKGGYDWRDTSSGFTMIEVLVVVVIIAIAAMMIVPMMGSAADMQLRSVSNMIAADLEYAKSMAIGRQKIYSVVFDASGESYQIEDPNGIIDHPIKKGFEYVVNFASDDRTDRVDIASVDFDTTNKVKFNYLGSPYNGNDTYLNSGTITLQADGMTTTITVEPVTGYISISN